MDPAAIIALVAALVAALAAFGSAIYARAQVNKIKSQLEQASAHGLTNMSIQQNWELFDRHKHLPPALPAWRDLSDGGWAWRILHLNHLNLLQLAQQDHKRQLLSKRELEGWILKARYWFQNLWADNPDSEIQQGRDVLRQVLRPEEGYPKDFCQWLIDVRIIPPDLISD